MEPVFKPLEFCNGKYGVSECGKVKSIYAESKHGKRRLTGTILKTMVGKRGYERIDLSWRVGDKLIVKNMAVHRLVGMAFHPNPENKPQINHKDTNKLNNHYTNLEWVTNKENSDHAQANGLVPYAQPRKKYPYKRKPLPHAIPRLPSHSRAVNIYDKEGNLVETTPSVRAVYFWLGIKKDKRIPEILGGKTGRKTCHGYTFKYASA